MRTHHVRTHHADASNSFLLFCLYYYFYSIGQNKNNTVLRLTTYLTECGYFNKVNCIFYIVGHTKNACDRWFNSLKADYRLSDIWSMEQLFKALATNPRIKIIRQWSSYPPNPAFIGFKGWTKFMALFYQLITGGKCLSGQIFTSNSNDPGIMQIKTDDMGTDAEHVQVQFKERGAAIRGSQRLKLLRDRTELTLLPPPGISEIKQMTLYTKWRLVVPREHWTATCPQPSLETRN